MPDLRTRIEQELATGHPARAHVAESVYYLCLVAAVTTLPMVGIILALAFRREWTRGWLIEAAVVIFGFYYAPFASSRPLSEALSIAPIVTTWIGPALLTGAALLLTLRRPRARA